MNLLDVIILGIIGLSIAYGLYSGLISSVINVVGLAAAWIGALCFYPRLSAWIAQNTSLLDLIVHYTEGASHLTSLETARTSVASAAYEFIVQTIQNAKFPAPFDTMLLDNITGQVFSGMGLTTIADYFNYTLAYAVLNIISFLLILAFVYLIFTIAGSIIGYVMRFPVLRVGDSLLGAAFGALRGVFVVFVLFMLLPVVLSVVQMDFLQELIDQSAFASFFYDGNFLLSAIKSVIHL